MKNIMLNDSHVSQQEIFELYLNKWKIKLDLELLFNCNANNKNEKHFRNLFYHSYDREQDH